MKLTLNIGLNVGDTQIWTREQALEQVRIHFNPELSFIRGGTYNGKKESTLVVKTEINPHKELNTIEHVKAICVTLQQDCIAAKIGTNNPSGLLIYHPRYKGERQEFNEKYFINP